MRDRAVLLVLLAAALVAGAACTRPGARWTTVRGAMGQAPDGVVYSVQTADSAVALTIDDGPDAEWTPRILDLLDSHGARATFFLIGSKVPGHESLVASIVERGHEIGNHMGRDEPSIALSPADFAQQLRETDALLSRWSRPRWVRPGSGWYDARMVEIASRHGYRVALGSVYPLDAQIAWPAFAGWFVLQGVRPGSVIVLHDGGARGERTLATLARVLPELGRRGLRVVSLSTLYEQADGGRPDA